MVRRPGLGLLYQKKKLQTISGCLDPHLRGTCLQPFPYIARLGRCRHPHDALFHAEKMSTGPGQPFLSLRCSGRLSHSALVEAIIIKYSVIVSCLMHSSMNAQAASDIDPCAVLRDEGFPGGLVAQVRITHGRTNHVRFGTRPARVSVKPAERSQAAAIRVGYFVL